jgi:hypothetical protein
LLLIKNDLAWACLLVVVVGPTQSTRFSLEEDAWQQGKDHRFTLHIPISLI